MIEELFINGSQVDIENVDIVRRYISPYFGDVTKLKNNGTYTVKLPLTINNNAIFEHCTRPDMATTKPYTILRANYYYEGFPIFLNAETKVLGFEKDFIEVQFVYGVNREVYLPLFNNYLNEIQTNGTTILDADWIVNWKTSGGTVYDLDKKYLYLNYISGIRTRDQETVSGVVQPPLPVPAPFYGHEKVMAWHPFIEYPNILDLIFADIAVTTVDLTEIKSRLENKGIILNKRGVDLVEYTRTITVPDDTYTGAQTFDLTDFEDDNDLISLITPSTGDHSVANVIQSNTPDIKAIFTFDFQSDRDGFKLITGSGTVLVANTFNAGLYTYSDTIEVTFNAGDFHFFLTFYDAGNFSVSSGSITIKYTLERDYYSLTTANGKYNCIANMPKIKSIEALQQALILTGGFAGYTADGDLKIYFLDEVKENIDNENVYDWSGKVSNIHKGNFQFNSNAQNNYIKFANDKDLKERFETITVEDETIDIEKDLYVIEFDSPITKVDEQAEFVLYEQSVKRTGTDGVSFENKYVGDNGNAALVKNLLGVAVSCDIADDNYLIYEKFVNKPIIVECDVNLGFYESATIDFTKPIYIQEFGKYCLLLELQAPNKELCAAKLLLINQQL